jgi:hypothetical protein
MTNYYLKEEPESYFSYWIQRKPEFPCLIGDEHGQNHPYNYPVDYPALNPAEKKFGELLLELHEKKVLFRIENLWDSDYCISIVDPVP